MKTEANSASENSFDRRNSTVIVRICLEQRVTEKMFGHPAPMREDESPEGLILHSAGPGQQGYYVYDIWESREAFERFMEEKLGPALAEVMGGPPPESGAPQYFPIDVLIVPR